MAQIRTGGVGAETSTSALPTPPTRTTSTSTARRCADSAVSIKYLSSIHMHKITLVELFSSRWMQREGVQVQVWPDPLWQLLHQPWRYLLGRMHARDPIQKKLFKKS